MAICNFYYPLARVGRWQANAYSPCLEYFSSIKYSSIFLPLLFSASLAIVLASLWPFFCVSYYKIALLRMNACYVPTTAVFLRDLCPASTVCDTSKRGAFGFDSSGQNLKGGAEPWHIALARPLTKPRTKPTFIARKLLHAVRAVTQSLYTAYKSQYRHRIRTQLISQIFKSRRARDPTSH